MGWRAQRHLVRPGEHFADVEMQILAALCDCTVERPSRSIAGEEDEHCAFALRRIDQRGKNPVERIAGCRGGFSDGHAVAFGKWAATAAAARGAASTSATAA